MTTLSAFLLTLGFLAPPAQLAQYSVPQPTLGVAYPIPQPGISARVAFWGLTFDGDDFAETVVASGLPSGDWDMEFWGLLTAAGIATTVPRGMEVGTLDDTIAVNETLALVIFNSNPHTETGGGDNLLTGSSEVVADTWFHHRATCSGSGAGATLRLYLNGVEEPESPATVTNSPGTSRIRLGWSVDEAAIRAWDGSIALPRIFSAIRTDAEAGEDMLKIVVNRPSVVTQWLGPGRGQVFIDRQKRNNLTFGADTGEATDDPVWTQRFTRITVAGPE